MKRHFFMFLTIISLIVFSIYFNKHMIDIRFYEMNIHLIHAATDAYASRTFSIISKYELIKRRIESRETDLENYAEEANLMVILASDTVPRAETSKLSSKWNPTRLILSGVRILLGKEPIDYTVNKVTLNKLEQAYVHERNRQYKNAILIYDEILNSTELTPKTSASILMHKAFCLSFLSNYESSAELYLNVAQNYSDSPEGILSGKLYNFIKSIQKQNIEISQEKKSSHIIGKQLYSHMDYKGAIKQLDAYLKTENPVQKNSAHFYKGRAHEEIGEYPNAVNEYSSLIDLGEGNPWAQKANRRLVMLGSFYEQKNSTISEAKKRLVKQGDTTFIKSIETIQKLAATTIEQPDTVVTAAIIDTTETTDLPDSSQIEQERREKEKQRKRELRDLARQKRIEEKRLNEKRKREEEKKRAAERKKRLANSPVRSPAFIKSTIDSKTGELKKIYLDYMANSSAVSGELVVEMRIKASGHIKASFISSTIDNRSFRRAIIRQIESWQFPPIDDDLGTVKIRYPFSFSQ